MWLPLLGEPSSEIEVDPKYPFWVPEMHLAYRKALSHNLEYSIVQEK